MPTVKSSFPMTSWKRNESVFTVGEMNSRSLMEVQQYLLGKNEWQALPELPDFSYNSAATVLNDALQFRRTALEVLGAVVGPTKKSDTGRR